MKRIGPAALALVLLACGGNAASTTTTAAPTTTRMEATTTTVAVTTTRMEATTTTVAVTTTSEPMASLPDTGVIATLDASYHTAGEFDSAVMGVGEGDVTARWYQAEGFYVVVFDGFDHDAAGPLCPGASVVLPGREGFWDFVANAPSPGADCSAFPTLSEDPGVRALVCDGQLAFRTAIPAESEGTLYGTLEKSDSGGIIGVTSAASTEQGEIAEIDIETLSC